MTCQLIRHTAEFLHGLLLSFYILDLVENKREIILDFSWEITQFNFTKRGGGDEAWTKSLS